MKNCIFVPVFKTCDGRQVYSVCSNYYFSSRKAAYEYAREFIAKSVHFDSFDINELMLYVKL